MEEYLIGELSVTSLTVFLAWLTQTHPLLLEPFVGWDFSAPTFLASGFALLWFCRGIYRSEGTAMLPLWRIACFLSGLAVIYLVLLTRFEYLAQHMFFLNRVQHLAMHHLGPFLIALSWPGTAIGRGMPTTLRQCCGSPPVRAVLRALQQPVLAFVLFEGLLILWLVPSIAFRSMFDWRLYAIMNASMVIDGLLFWFLVLDPRPGPFFARLVLAFIVIFPQIAVGTALGLAATDLYPAYSLCGRVYASLGPLDDQRIGALILWVPAGMMSAIAALLIMSRMFRQEDAAARLSPLPVEGLAP